MKHTFTKITAEIGKGFFWTSGICINDLFCLINRQNYIIMLMITRWLVFQGSLRADSADFFSESLHAACVERDQ